MFSVLLVIDHNFFSNNQKYKHENSFQHLMKDEENYNRRKLKDLQRPRTGETKSRCHYIDKLRRRQAENQQEQVQACWFTAAFNSFESMSEQYFAVKAISHQLRYYPLPQGFVNMRSKRGWEFLIVLKKKGIHFLKWQWLQVLIDINRYKSRGM